MPPFDEDNRRHVQLMQSIGFTVTQAKLYLALLRIGKADVKTLAKNVKVPRQAIYRTLSELQEKGLCAKILSNPHEFEAISIRDGLRLMLDSKADEYTRISEKAKELLTIYNSEETVHSIDKEYRISIVEGRDTILRMTRNAHTKVQERVSCCTTLQRWVQVGQEIHQSIIDSLNKGVKYRTILEKTTCECIIPNELKLLIDHQNFDVRIISDSLKSNAAIFDSEVASFSFYPSKSLSESPMIWTNHPSLIVGFQAYFEKEWGLAKPWTDTSYNLKATPKMLNFLHQY